jgi:hypothetical protein
MAIHFGRCSSPGLLLTQGNWLCDFKATTIHSISEGNIIVILSSLFAVGNKSALWLKVSRIGIPQPA